MLTEPLPAATSPAVPSAKSSAATRVRRLPLWKKLIFSGITVAIAWCLVEFCSWILLGWNYAPLEFVQRDLHRQAASTAILGIGRDPTGDGPEASQPEIVHPYLGYVRRPRGPQAGDPGVSEYGFSGSSSPIRRREPGQVLVAVTGGSVAETLATEAADVLRERLERLPRFAGKRIVIVPIGLLAYKQPQQLLTLNYLLALGAEYDVVINLDGFNELVLPATSNAPNHLAASYPWEWHLRVTPATDMDTLRLLGRITHLQDAAQSWARCFSSTLLQHSPTALLVWRAVHDQFQRAALDHYRSFRARVSVKAEPAILGPRDSFSDDVGFQRHCVDLWKRSSLQMHRLCQESGIAYYHFLQPNQYLPGSKPLMTDSERLLALEPGIPAALQVEQGYPLLIAAGRELQAQSVRFHDLSGIFAETATPTYSDRCCHLNAEGNRLLSDAIARAIASEE